ncbi:MAG: SurA N-terminal domain-containing protein [Bacteroidales bacterium]|nr:SurA N-terminal domain-containing protein [Bacteroidales bacterium]
MAILGKLRSKGVLLLVVVGVALLAFIVGDFISNSQSLRMDRRAYVGKVSGEKVKLQEYNERLNQLTGVFKIEYGSQSLPENAMENIRQNTWDEIVNERLIQKACDDLGLTVSHEELNDLILGNNPSPYITGRRAFTNPETGQFDRNIVAAFVAQIDNDAMAQQIGYEELQNWRSYWKYWEKTVKMARLQEKYTNLIAKSIVVNKIEAQDAYNSNKVSATIVFAAKPYVMVSDSAVKVDDAKVKELYNKRKEQFKQETNCDLQYVAINVAPSQEDFDNALATMQEHRAEFLATTDVEEFVNYYSEEPYSDNNLASDDVDEDLREFAFSASRDSVFGPFLGADNTYKMARIIENGIVAPDSVKLRHILVFREDEKQTKALADSLVAAINNGSDFAELAAQFSLAQQTAKNGGEIGWVREIYLDEKEVAEKAFSKPVGELFTVNAINGAIQIFQVTERGAMVPKVKLATVLHKVIASSSTHSALYQQAKDIASNSNNTEEFNKAVTEKGLLSATAKNVEINSGRVNDLPQARQIVKWAFENKVGAVSDVFECDDRLVVASVTRIAEKGYRSLDEVRPEIEAELRQEAKAEILKKQMEGKSIEALMAENCTVDTIPGLTFSTPYAGALGNEPVVCALAPRAEINKLSEPVAGNMGVIVFKVISKEENDRAYNEQEEKAMQAMRLQYVIPYLSIQSLRDDANVEDLRYKFY